MAENVIDTLKLDIIVNTKQNGQSITTLRNSLEKLYKFLNGVNNQDLSKVSNDIAKIGGRLTPLVNAINSLDGQGLKNLTSLGTRLQTLNKRMGEIDAKAMARKFDQMTQAITPFIDKVMSAQEALVALNNVMGGAKTLTKTATPKATTTTPKATNNTNILGGKLGKSLNFGSMIAKLYFVRNITKQLGQDLAKVVQYGIDYEETLNLWQVAMKGNTAEARKFITEMNRAYGISEITLMNYQATFKNMLSSLGGINQEVAYGLSETLSQMALDYASLYNTSIESAMTKFQAVLAGQVRPIRSESGYDITQATLYEVYKDIGGTKSVRQLSETEKRLLRILAVYRQMKDTAVGDYAKTIYSTANQTRYMKETIKDIATWIGVGANQWLKQSGILIRINSYLLALKELAKSFAISMGYVEESEEKAQDPLGDIEQGWDDINKQVDEYQGKLLGFDKFQVLTSAGTDGADIPAELLKAMQEYESILGKSQNVALFGDAEKNIKGAYDILKDLGFVYDEASGQWLKDGKTVKENIEDIAKSFGAVLFVVSLIAKPFLAIAGAIEYCYATNENFKKSVDESFERIKENAKGVLPLFTSIFEKALPIIEEIALFVLDIVELISPLVEDILEPLIPILEPIRKIFGDVFQLVKNIISVLAPIISMIAEALNILTPILEIVHGITWVVSTVLSGAVQTVLWVLTPVLAVFEAILKVVESIGEVVRALFQWDWGSLGKNLSNIWTDWKIDDLATANNNMKWQPSWKADGGLATKGSLFYAGEAGPELVTQTSGGGSTIMNMKQLEDAVARGFIRGAAATQGDEGQQITVNVSGRNLFSIFVEEARSNGYELVKVR
jgi:hypothetical protein